MHAGTRRAPVRRRAVGTRDRIIGHLAGIAEIADPAGMASARLAAAVEYPGSSVAFAQLLSGMERDGLITRDVRGKRTYRIALTAAVTPPPARAAAAPYDVAGAGGIDYDELARRLLAHLIRRVSQLDPGELATLERLLAPGVS